MEVNDLFDIITRENPLQRYDIHTDEVIDWFENQKPICSGRM